MGRMRWFGLLLALCLCVTGAMAETKVSAYDLENRSVELNKATNTLTMRTEDGRYQVIDAQGNPLSETYGAIRGKNQYFSVANEDAVNCWGLIDGQGNPVMPMQYGDVETLSDRWTAGIVLTEATADNYDYTTLFSSEKAYFLIDTVDFYYRGTKVGTLDRMNWNSADAYGDYLHVRTRESGHLFYDKDFNPSPRTAEYTGEYDDDYKTKTIWHQGSGQAAFTEGCTLTAEEVAQDTYVVNGNTLTALDGTVIADLSRYYSVYGKGGTDYIRVRATGEDNTYGLINAAGEEVVPCVYDEFDYSLDTVGKLGYIYAVREGKGGFINLETGEETGFLYSKDVTKNYACYMKATDLDGSIIVISAAAGRLSNAFQDVSMDYAGNSTGNRLFIGLNADGTAGVYGLYGEEVIPAEAKFDSLYDFTISSDGTTILANAGYGAYTIYTVEYDPASGAAQ